MTTEELEIKIREIIYKTTLSSASAGIYPPMYDEDDATQDIMKLVKEFTNE
jgi:hypothetical protein